MSSIHVSYLSITAYGQSSPEGSQSFLLSQPLASASTLTQFPQAVEIR